MGLYVDVERFRSSTVLPFGASAGDQDALFWQARDVVDAAMSELRGAGGAPQ